MKSLRSGFVTVLAAGALVVLPTTNPRSTRVVTRHGPPDPKALYSRTEKEFWLSADEFGYVRPGFKITVNSITINSDLHPVVDVSFTDDLDQPLDRAGKITPGALSVNFVLAWWDVGERQYTAYTTRIQTSPITHVSATQAAADSGGTWEDLDLGHAIYTFKTALPGGYDATRTHTLGIYATRNLLAVPDGNFDKNYFANVEQDFRPDGAPVTEVWDMTGNAACNTCHNPLSAHGGSRRDVKLCVLCHSPQTVDPDTGNTVDFKVMVHKIHRGENLPSVESGTPYVIIGNQQSIHDFSTVAFPQDIRNCATCHAPPATQAPNWYTFPTRAACQSCHDDVNFATGENHAGGIQIDDSHCADCHRPQGDREWDASVIGAHTVPFKSAQLKGLHAEILSVANAGPGQMPTVSFRITENDGAVVNPASLGSNLNVLMGGPTTDYAINPFRERADGAAVSGDTASYTFTHAIPADAIGTWTFSMEVRRTLTLDPAPATGPSVTEAAFNPIHYAAITDAEAVPRRMVVELANCNTCHDRLALHGGQRLNTEECVICHNPNANDSARRQAEQGAPESIDFKRLIHRIHTGENLTQDFTVIGFGGSVNNFNELRFPGDRRDCATCHTGDSQQVSETPPRGLLPTETLRDWYTPQQHYAAACLGCHDNKPAAAHAFVMTAPFGEACATCHGPDADFSVDKVHAR